MVCPIDNGSLLPFVPPLSKAGHDKRPVQTKETRIPWVLPRRKRYGSLALIWVVALLASAITVIDKEETLLTALVYFPLAPYVICGLAGLSLNFNSAAALGWFAYLSLSCMVVLARKRFVYYTVYFVLSLLLMLNVVSCYAMYLAP